jgi:uncharacterized protein (DUF1800 family)
MDAPTRRDLLKATGFALGVSVAGCAPIARRLPKNEIPDDLSLPPGKSDETVRLLNRGTFGPRPGQVAEVKALGHQAWVEAQLARSSPEDYRLQAQLARLDVLRIDGYELHDLSEDFMLRQLNQAALLRAVYSGDQVFERLVDLWTNHFNIYARKGLASYRKAKDEKNVIRAHALGRFPDMLRASAKSPAMLAYLDNQFSRKEAPNENYARELMELHTLGVGGGYTQRDVREVARCFTGWSIERRFLRPRGSFRFDPERHDTGEKVVLGHRIPAGGGVEDGERVLDILATHPQTASFIAGKLARHFIGDADSPLRDGLAKTYLATGGDIKAMVRQTLLSREILNGPPIAKRPFDFLASALRALDVESDCGPPLQKHLEAMGQALYEWPMPDGYPDGAEPWTGSLLARWNFAVSLTENKIDGTDINLEQLVKRTGEGSAQGLATLVLNRRLQTDEKRRHERLAKSDPGRTALLLASPEFQWR